MSGGLLQVQRTPKKWATYGTGCDARSLMRPSRFVHKVIPRTWGRRAGPLQPLQNDAIAYLMLKAGRETESI